MISNEMARCIAKVCGDGSLSKKDVRYTNTSDILLEQFKRDMSLEFGNLHFTTGKVSSGTKFVCVTNKAVVAAFRQHLESYRSYDISIPKEIAENPRLLREFLISFFDDEGCATIRLYRKTMEWKRNITVASNSIKIINQIKAVLKNIFQIKTNSIIRDFKEDKVWYILSITGKANFINFKEKLGFTQPIKANRLELIIKSYNATYSRNKEAFMELCNELNKLRKVPIPAHVLS